MTKGEAERIFSLYRKEYRNDKKCLSLLEDLEIDLL